MKTYKDKIVKLLPNQKFVFSANSLGFYGRGSASHAMEEQRSL